MNPLEDVNLHHAALSVADMERAIAFYGDVFGFRVDTRVTADDGSMEIVHLRKGDRFIELFCHRDPLPLPDHAADLGLDVRTIGTKHLAFATDDPHGTHAALAARGVDGLTAVHEARYYYYFFLKDPDGITLEIVSRKTGENA
ncbi:MAG: hypothetical protein D6782_13170 [Alphaproteobacteria bacterium]|nr:MAG: hypothetical protein D6782_13170 [Alphaproteobacteria bacterium]